LRSRLSDQVAVTSNGTEIFLYAPAAGSADEAAQVARQVLARHDVSASVRTEFWSSLKEEWRDVTDEPSADPVAERRAAGREMSRKVGFVSGLFICTCDHDQRQRSLRGSGCHGT
jgi:hypothetical protein